ncbi:MAG TPA: DUF5916 domain-containing protein [Vicinamibacteria bacterium]|nr:DUF5916 domain-containing protein [Vicinamibacteria bacterium]
MASLLGLPLGEGPRVGPGTVAVPKGSDAPRIDCRLDEPAWMSAARLGGFRQTYPGDNAPPSHDTEVLLVYSSHALFVGLRAEADPRHVRATLARRDAIGDDDSISLYLDTFHDRRRAYVLMVNPLGVQQDGYFVEGSEPDFSLDVVFESAGCLDDGGYTVEIAIPFESLRYEAGPGRNWGLHVLRLLKHETEETSWMPLRRDRVGVAGTSRELRARFLEQAGSLTGLEEVGGARIVEVTPVASVARPSDGPTAAGLGGSARVTLTPALISDLALNPDFAEIEADQPQSTANQRFPLFFTEKRPFFLEGADLLLTPARAFHSRRIVDPDAAVKITATRGRTSGTALVARDAARQADAYASVLRLRTDVGSQSSLGFLGTSRRGGDAASDLISADGRLAVGAGAVWTFQGLATRTQGDLGFGYYTEWARSDRRTSLQLVGEGYSPGYAAELGYTQRTDTNRWSAVFRYNGQPGAGGPLVSWSVANTLHAQFDWRGRMQYSYVYPRVLLTFPRQTFLNAYAYNDYVRVFEEEYGPSPSPGQAGAFVGASERSTRYTGVTLQGGTAPSRSLSLEALYDRTWNTLDYDLGAGRFPRVSPAALADPSAAFDPGRADSALLSASLALRPGDAFNLSVGYEHGRMIRRDTQRAVFDQHLASVRLQYAFSRATWLRGRLDHDSLDGRVFHQVVFGWNPSPGTAFYLGYDESGVWSDSSRPRYVRRDRTLFAKLSLNQRVRLNE